MSKTFLGETGLKELISKIKTLVATKQDKLTAGDNISISGSTISAKDTVYTLPKATYNQLGGIIVGNNLSISDGMLSATDTTYSSKTATSGGTDVSLCTTGEKYTWNNKTSNTGTVTSVAVKMNNTTKGTVTSSGTIDLGTVITDISGKQDTTTAVKHTASTAVGSATQPAYIASDGTATKCTYSLNKTVPSDAKFTDTTYTGATLKTNAAQSGTAQTSVSTSIQSGTSMDGAIKTLLNNDATLNNRIPYKIVTGIVSNSVSYTAGWNVIHTVNFASGQFSSTPTVLFSPTDLNTATCNVGYVGTDGFNIKTYLDGAGTYTFTGNWVAIGQ